MRWFLLVAWLSARARADCGDGAEVSATPASDRCGEPLSSDAHKGRKGPESADWVDPLSLLQLRRSAAGAMSSSQRTNTASARGTASCSSCLHAT